MQGDIKTDNIKIHKLPAEARSKLQSGIIITDAVQCVLELVYNSLDAEATGIAVRIDLKNYQIRVIDNGKGISRNDLELVGERFMTSKYCFNNLNSSTSTYGYKGQAISSMLDACSSLIIETKPNMDNISYIKVFKNNMALPIMESSKEKNGTGTTVTIEDFMCTMPVRRKRINEVFDIEEIKTQLQHLAIIHYNVCFTLRNENKGLNLLQTHQTTSILLSIASIFGKSVAKSLIPLKHKEKKYGISGFISMRPQRRNNLQLLYVNNRKVKKCGIHKSVNDLMTRYLLEEEFSGDSSLDQDFVLKNLRNSSHNVFILLIICPHSHYELFPSMGKSEIEFRNWKEVIKSVCMAIKKALRYDDESLSSPLKVKKIGNEGKEDGKVKTKFGTSLLLNAVRGVAVKRRVNITVDTKKRRKKNENEDFNELLLYNENRICFEDNVTAVKPGKKVIHEADIDCTCDSLESPIPKKCLKPFYQEEAISNSNSLEISTKDLNQSFLQFYEWLKEKFETDPNSFNFYKDFLLYKQRKNDFELDNFDKRQISKRKSKGKDIFSGIKKFCTKQDAKGIAMSGTLISENKTCHVKTPRKNLKALLDRSLKNKDSVRFLRRNDVRYYDESRKLNMNFEDVKKLKVARQCSEWKPGEWAEPHILNKNHVMKVYQTSTSPAMSEVVFTNIIKFRNSSESFECHSSHVKRQTFPEKNSTSISGTWKSHYQDEEFTNFVADGGRREEECGFPLTDSYRRTRFQFENTNLQKCESFELESYGFRNYANPLKFGRPLENTLTYRDAKIQTDSSETGLPVKTVDAMIQTSVSNKPLDETRASNAESSFLIVSESPCFDNFDHLSFGQTLENHVLEYHEIDESLALTEDQIRETGDPESRDIHKPESSDKNKENNIVLVNSRSPDFDCSMKNNPKTDLAPVGPVSSSSQVLYCAQKSGETERNQHESGVSKETLTVAAMLKDCLADIGSVSEDTFVEASGNDKKSGSTQLTKTIPIEELDLNFSSVPEIAFSMSERHDIVPKGLSPACLRTRDSKISILSPHEKSRIKLIIDNSENELLASVKWQDESTGGSTKPTILDGILDEMRQKAEKNMIYYENEILSASLSYCAIKVHNLLHSFAFTKELLSCVEILGQLDRKFIVAKMRVSSPKKMELISVFDQHAVDERIKLEELINDYIGPDGKFISTPLSPPTECILEESVVRVISNDVENLLSYGLEIHIKNEKTASIFSIPKFLMDKHEKEAKTKKNASLVNILQTLINDIVKELTETRGTASMFPSIIRNAFCSEACQKAIKFNRMLTVEDMREMIGKLKGCKTPFQCAHGRPSVIPIIDLEEFKSKETQSDSVDVQKLVNFARQKNTQDDIIENSGEK